MSEQMVVFWWDSESEPERWRVEIQRKNSQGQYESVSGSDTAGFPVNADNFGPLDEDLLIQSIKTSFPEAHIALKF